MGTSQKRDMDLIRDLLLAIEGGRLTYQAIEPAQAEMLGIEIEPGQPFSDREDLRYHLELLDDAKFIAGHGVSGGWWIVERMTWSGHEFLDTIRDDDVWKKTKAVAGKVGGASVSFLWEIAKAEVKMKLGLP